MVPRSPTKDAQPAALEVGAVFNLLGQVAHRLRQIHGRTTRQSGLTPAQYVVVQTLWAEDRQSPAALASAAGCTRATMTGLLDSLEKGTFVRREPNPADRRSLLVALTGKGKSLRRFTPDIQKLFGSCCLGLSTREVGQLGALLTKLNEALRRSDGGCSCSKRGVP
jgi:DNA-binding MarR family transcriptional regulator